MGRFEISIGRYQPELKTLIQPGALKQKGAEARRRH